MNKVNSNDYEKELMPIPHYLLKKCRRDLKWTLKVASYNLDIESSYINKIENGRVVIPDHLLKTFVHVYDLDEDKISYCDFDQSFLDFYMYKISNSSLSDENIQYLTMKRERYRNTYYELYLCLLIFAYKSYRQQYDDEFVEDYKDLCKLVTCLNEKEQYFFYSFAMHYAIRIHDMKSYQEFLRKLKQYSFHFLDSINAYTKILAILFMNQTELLLDEVDQCKQCIKEHPNHKIESALLFIQARYYRDIHNYHHAIEVYLQYASLCQEAGEMDNYGIAENSIGFLYGQQKQFQLAVEHYLKAIPYVNYADFYFDLAWCYYCLNDRTNALKYALMGQGAIIDHKKWELFLEWLILKINDENPKKCESKLVTIYKMYYGDLSIEMKKFLLIALANHAKEDENKQKANQYLCELVNLVVESNIQIEM